MFEQVDATVSSVIDFPRFDLQYFGTEYHSALALRLAIVAKPQIIVLDSDAPFISVSKFVSILRENDVNCVLILLEGSGARHEPCPGIAAIRLGRNDLSPQRVQDAFRHAIAMADSRSAIRLTVSSPHQMPDDLLAYLQSGGPLTPARLALLFPRTQWVNYKHTQATAARSVGVSASYLCAVLKKSLGMTYIDLLTNVRIYHAKRLLAEDPTQRTIRSPPWPGSTTSGISPRFSAALPAARRSNTRIHSQKGGPQSVKAAYYPSPGQVALHDVPEPGLRHRDEVKPHPLCRRL